MADGCCVSRGETRIVRSKEKNSGRTVDIYDVLYGSNEIGNCLDGLEKVKEGGQVAEVTLAKEQTRH